MKALIADAQALPKPSLPDYEPIETTHTGKGVASNHALLDIYQKQVEGYHRMWHHHFEFLLLGYGAYMTFFDFCKKAFPEITDQAISRMVAGMEAEIFRPDEEVKRLARRAVELGVDRHFTDDMDIDQVLADLDAGRQRGQGMARRARDQPQPVVQRQQRRRVLPLPPQLEGRPVAAVRGAPRLHREDQGRHQHRAADRAADRGAQPAGQPTTASCSTPTRTARPTTS